MNVFISGGCKNGKSGFAQDIAVKLSALVNIITFRATIMLTPKVISQELPEKIIRYPIITKSNEKVRDTA